MYGKSWRSAARTAGLAALLLTLGTGSAGAGEGPVTRLTVAPGSRFWLEGTTNVSSWACRSERIHGSVEVDAPAAVVSALLERAVGTAPGEVAGAAGELPNPRLRLGIPVAALACGNRLMERDLRNALRAAEHPAVVYEYERVTDLAPLGGSAAGTRRFGIGVEGDLALAGSERKVRTRVVGERLAPGLYRVTGELDLRMTDFGVQPPTALMGMIEAHDPLRVRFDLRLALADERRAERGARPRRDGR